jgi:hypothetical protein
MKKYRFIAVFSVFMGFTALPAQAGVIAECLTKLCAADDLGCVELKVRINANDAGGEDSKDLVEVTRKLGSQRDTYYRGSVRLSFDREACMLSLVEAQHTSKEFSMSANLVDQSGYLSLLVKNESLPDSLSTLSCVFASEEEHYPQKMHEMRKDIMRCQKNKH